MPKGDDKSQLNERLKGWFDNGVISGFGDVRQQATRIDESVRAAREISAEHFTVQDELLRQIEKHWQDNFMPSNVRAEPHKIHLYGPGGMFKPHRDTPQAGLVGTFLLGLGDTSGNYAPNFQVGTEHSQHAHEGYWIAFYPDEPHEVRKIPKDSYRAVVAFKIFWQDLPTPDATIPLHPAISAAAQKLVSHLEPPFGLILDRKYCIGTKELSGVDRVLASLLHSKADTKALIIPILTEQNLFDNHRNQEQIITIVHPFTPKLIDAMRDSPYGAASEELENWKSLKDVSFFELREEAGMEKWSGDREDINWTGNESDGLREDSLYLAYALLCLPSTHELVL